MSDKKTQDSSPIYDVEIPTREALLALVQKELQPVPFEGFVAAFKLSDAEQIGVKRRLRAMERDGQLVFTRSKAYGLPERMGLLQGRVIGHRDGFGFVELEQGGPDLFLPHHQMQLALHGDKVLVKAGFADAKGRQEARLVRVVEAGPKTVVGRFFVEQGIGIVVPDDTRLHQDFVIPPEHTLNAKHGQIVVAEMIGRPSRRSHPVGKVVEVLGEHLAPGMEITVAIRQHGLPHEWPAAIEQALAAIPDEVQAADMTGRVDLQHLPFVTIDGEDARDFDDAVYCEIQGKGNKQHFKLWVAIADVSHYVRPGSALDEAAYERGNSVYFPNHVIPMLPEKLSNGLCSLNPDVSRLSMVAELTVDKCGNLMASVFYPAVIKSAARLTYTSVAKMIETPDAVTDKEKLYLNLIAPLYAFYQAAREKRQRRGAIDFDTSETRFIFNAERKIERIEPVIRNDAHRLIEESMIMANIAAAREIEASPYAGLFRVHEQPSEEKLESFRLLLGELGIVMPARDEPLPSDFSKVLAQVAERPDKELIEMMLLRSLQQAVYSPDNEGHFGLALKSYTHFTSPIRRYPDLVVHRVIKQILYKKKQLKQPVGQAYSHEQLLQLGQHCSQTERRADEATRQVNEWLKAEYMQDRIGEHFDGVIGSVTSFGLFVRLEALQIEGLVHVSNMPAEYYHFDAKRQFLLGEQTRQVYRVGDTVEVQVLKVDLDERKIDFKLIAHKASETELEVPLAVPEARQTKSQSRKQLKKSVKRQTKKQGLSKRRSKRTQGKVVKKPKNKRR